MFRRSFHESLVSYVIHYLTLPHFFMSIIILYFSSCCAFYGFCAAIATILGKELIRCSISVLWRLIFYFQLRESFKTVIGKQNA